jgi:hypothetical protein
MKIPKQNLDQFLERIRKTYTMTPERRMRRQEMVSRVMRYWAHLAMQPPPPQPPSRVSAVNLALSAEP